MLLVTFNAGNTQLVSYDSSYNSGDIDAKINASFCDNLLDTYNVQI